MIKKITHKIFSSPAFDSVINKTKKLYLPGFYGIPLYDVLVFFMVHVNKTGMTERASAISFNLVMAIPSAIMFLFTLIPYLPISREFEEGLYSIIREIVPGEEQNSAIIRFLQDFINKPRNGLLSFAFILSIYFSSNAMMGIQRSFDKNYPGFKQRNAWQKRLSALKVTFIIYVLVFISVLLLVAQEKVLSLIGIGQVWKNIIIHSRWIVIVLLYFYCISYIYRHAPAVDKKWRLINPGSILATILMLCTTLIFSWWVSRFGYYHQLYGSIGTIIILMGLIFVNSMVLLIGFELNVSISSLKKILDEQKNSDTVKQVS